MNARIHWLWRSWQIARLAIFEALCLFWLIKSAYCLHAYYTNGIPGVRRVILHGMPLTPDPRTWGQARWDLVILRYAAIALMTVLFGVMSRIEFKEQWRELRSGGRMAHPK
jgi:hypothetical protein